MKLSTQVYAPLLFAVCLAIPLQLNAIECPYQLLWSNGVVWAYRTVECESPKKCNVPTNVVLMYNHSVGTTGCGGATCDCNLADEDNDFLGQTAVDGGNLPPIHVIAPNKTATNNSCNHLDQFNVPVTGTQTYFQCIEFRFKPDPAGPLKNVRVALQLNAQPTTHLMNENVTYDDANTPKKLIRVVGGDNIEYEIVRSGRITVPENPAGGQSNGETGGTSGPG